MCHIGQKRLEAVALILGRQFNKPLMEGILLGAVHQYDEDTSSIQPILDGGYILMGDTLETINRNGDKKKQRN